MKTSAFLFAFLALPLCSHAATVVGTASGQVTSIFRGGSAAPPTGIIIGDAVSVSWQYDDSTSPSFTTSTKAIFRQPELVSLSMTVRIHSYDWIASAGKIEVSDNDPTEHDRISYFSDQANQFVSFPGYLGGFSTIGAFSASDQTSPFNLLSSLSLPSQTSDLDLSSATSIGYGVATEAANASGDKWGVFFQFQPATVSISTVPEPSSVLFLFSGTVLLLCRKRVTMRCSKQAPRSRHLQQTTTTFPPTGRCRARSACR